jgi:hypothetical protein
LVSNASVGAPIASQMAAKGIMNWQRVKGMVIFCLVQNLNFGGLSRFEMRLG